MKALPVRKVLVGLLALVVLGLLVALTGNKLCKKQDSNESTVVSVHQGDGVTLRLSPLEEIEFDFISIQPVQEKPWGSIEAYQFNPDGLEFTNPAEVIIDISTLELPPGTELDSLRIAYLDNGKWRYLESSRYNASTGDLKAEINHFSTYGIIPEAGEINEVGTLFELNGISILASEDVYLRLSVTPELVTASLSAKPGSLVDLTISGIPTTGSHYIYINDHDTVVPVSGTSTTVSLNLDEPQFLWVQPFESTIHIGGSGDECYLVGTRVGNTCTLSTDIIGEVAIDADDQILDCNGHYIMQDSDWPSAGLGVLISYRNNVSVRNCKIGVTDQSFGTGIFSFHSSYVTIHGCDFEDNDTSIGLNNTSFSSVYDNTVGGSLTRVGICMTDDTHDNEIFENSLVMGLPNQSIGIWLSGGYYVGTEVVLLQVMENQIYDNDVDSRGNGIGFSIAIDNHVHGSDFFADYYEVRIQDEGWPNSVYHNNILSADMKVYSEVPAEISSTDEGNYWNRPCPGPLFIPGTDSNRTDALDSFPFGQVDAWDLGLSPGCLPGDVDGDTVPDDIDNCPYVWNPGQENVDGIGEGDACDTTAPISPVIESPTNLSVISTSLPLIQGTAEPHSRVDLLKPGSVIGSTYASATGSFYITPYSPLLDGLHSISAVATDAADNTSESSPIVSIMVDTIAPSPPTIVSPYHGEIVHDRYLSITGNGEPASTITVFANLALLASGRVDETGRFTLTSEVPLDSGDNLIIAFCTDSAGNTSERSDVVVAKYIGISETSPLSADGGKFLLSSVLDDPDPFDPYLEPVNISVNLVVTPVAGINGSSPNFEFSVVMEGGIWNEDRTELINEVAGTLTVVPRSDSGSNVEVSTVLSWDGKDSSGLHMSSDTFVRYDITISLIRNWTGPGNGPRCSREEVELTEPGYHSCLIDILALPDAGSILLQHDDIQSSAEQLFMEITDLDKKYKDELVLHRATMPTSTWNIWNDINGTSFASPWQLEYRFSRDGYVQSVNGLLLNMSSLSDDSTVEQQAWDTLNRYRTLLGIDIPSEELIIDDIETDWKDGRHVHFRQVINGYNVLDGGIVVHISPEKYVTGWHANVVPTGTVDIYEPQISESAAIDYAISYHEEPGTISSTAAQLVIIPSRIYHKQQGGASLAYAVALVAEPQEKSRIMYISANNGDLLLHAPWGHREMVSVYHCPSALDPNACRRHTAWDSTWTYVDDPFCPPGSLNFEGINVVDRGIIMTSPFPGTSGIVFDAIRDAEAMYKGPELDHNFSFLWPSSYSLDCYESTELIAFCDTNGDPPYNFGKESGASWVSNDPLYPPLSQKGYMLLSPDFSCSDVVGHELTHGIANSVDWYNLYSYGGELQEGTCDVMGELVNAYTPERRLEQYDWKMGGSEVHGCPKVIRNLVDTDSVCAAHGRHRDNYSEYSFLLNIDGNHPHHNSTILSSMACLLGWEPFMTEASIGCSGERYGVDVYPIDDDLVGATRSLVLTKLWYETFTKYLSPPLSFEDFTDALIWGSVPPFLTFHRVLTMKAVSSARFAIGIWTGDILYPWHTYYGTAGDWFSFDGDERDRPHVVYVDSTTGLLMHRRERYSTDGIPSASEDFWSHETALHFAFGKPAVVATSDRLWVFFTVGDLGTMCAPVFYMTLDKYGHWSTAQAVPDALASLGRLTAAEFDDRIFLFYRSCGSGPQRIKQHTCLLDTVLCTSPSIVVTTGGSAIQSRHAPAAASSGEELFLVFGSYHSTWDYNPHGDTPSYDEADVLMTVVIRESGGIYSTSYPEYVGPEEIAHDGTYEGRDCYRIGYFPLVITETPDATVYKGRLHTAAIGTGYDFEGRPLPGSGTLYVGSSADPLDRRQWTMIVPMEPMGIAWDLSFDNLYPTLVADDSHGIILFRNEFGSDTVWARLKKSSH